MRTIKQIEKATLQYDEEYKIILFSWYGVVSHEVLKEFVLAAAEIMNQSDHFHLMFDRRELETYSAEAKEWIKNDFMKKEGKELIKKVKKIAAVNAKSTIAQLISTLLVGVLKLYNRKAKYQMFDTPEEALLWIKKGKVSH